MKGLVLEFSSAFFPGQFVTSSTGITLLLVKDKGVSSRMINKRPFSMCWKISIWYLFEVNSSLQAPR